MASFPPCFGVTITRQLMRSQDIDFGDNGVGFAFTEVSLISSAEDGGIHVLKVACHFFQVHWVHQGL